MNARPESDRPGEVPRALAIVPARLGSTRLPRKMLLAETGLPLFVHTARNVAACPAIERVVVATDSEEILAAAGRFDVEARMTSEAHTSGTDRVHEAAGQLAALGETYSVIVNVQGDEPELPHAPLGALVAAFCSPEVRVATLATVLAEGSSGDPLEGPDPRTDPSVVKVVVDRNGDALYFSRAPIPALGHGPRGSHAAVRRHVGVYAFRPEALDRFCSLPHGVLERAESLEQLRWLEAGHRLRVLDSPEVPVGIDTEVHYSLFVERQRDTTPRVPPTA